MGRAAGIGAACMQRLQSAPAHPCPASPARAAGSLQPSGIARRWRCNRHAASSPQPSAADVARWRGVHTGLLDQPCIGMADRAEGRRLGGGRGWLAQASAAILQQCVGAQGCRCQAGRQGDECAGRHSRTTAAGARNKRVGIRPSTGSAARHKCVDLGAATQLGSKLAVFQHWSRGALAPQPALARPQRKECQHHGDDCRQGGGNEW